MLWKAYIDFETELEEFDKARDLYERLLQKTQHVKVWIAYAEFEVSVHHLPTHVRISIVISPYQSSSVLCGHHSFSTVPTVLRDKSSRVVPYLLDLTAASRYLE